MGSQELTRGSLVAKRHWLVLVLIILAILIQVAASTLVASFGQRSTDELIVFFQALLVASALTVPGVAFVAWIDRRERESPWLYAFALGWGMIGAAGLSLLLDTEAFRSMLGVVVNVDSSVASVTGFTDATRLFVAVVLAPPIEELTKAIALVLLAVFLRGQFFTMRDGIVFGLLVGMGFNLLEAPFYLMNAYAETGEVPWMQQLISRFLFLGLDGHALYTALFGAGLGYFAQRGGIKGIVAAVLGGVLAIVAHILNNGLGGIALGLALTAMGYRLDEITDAAAFFASLSPVTYWVADALATLIVQGWAYLLLIVLLIRSARHERRVIVEELAAEVGGSVSPGEYDGVKTEGWLHLRRIHGMPPARARALVNAQNKIALYRSLARSRGHDPETDPNVEAWRAEVDRLRLAD